MQNNYRWSDYPNRHERRRRYALMRIIKEFKPTPGAFGASPLNTQKAVKRRAQKYYDESK